MTTVTTILPSDIESLEFELSRKEPVVKTTNQYVNNKELQAEFVVYHAKKVQWQSEGRGNPPLTNKIGQAIMDIATRRTYSRNFIGYTQSWKEEMIGDAIETCVKYCHNYDPTRFNNPFAYITQLVTNAIIQRIKREKTQTYIKYKAFDNANGFHGELDDNLCEDDIQLINENSGMYNDYLSYIADFEDKYMKKGAKEDVDNVDKGLLEFLSTDSEEEVSV